MEDTALTASPANAASHALKLRRPRLFVTTAEPPRAPAGKHAPEAEATMSSPKRCERYG